MKKEKIKGNVKDSPLFFIAYTVIWGFIIILGIETYKAIICKETSDIIMGIIAEAGLITFAGVYTYSKIKTHQKRKK